MHKVFMQYPFKERGVHDIQDCRAENDSKHSVEGKGCGFRIVKSKNSYTSILLLRCRASLQHFFDTLRTYAFHVLSPLIKGATPSPLGAGVVTSLLPKTAVLPLLRENSVKCVSPTIL